jgi:prepilin-type N-terminal cleavage/methylation domain-containing protein
MRRRRGLTLIELIISIAIVGIISIAILGIFSAGTKNMVSSDDRTKNTLKGKDKTDDLIIKLNDPSVDPDSLVEDDVNIQDSEFDVDLPGVEDTINVKGKTLEIITTDETGNTIKIETFVPDDLESGASEGS